MPTFSIIVPVYNVAPYLRECLDSVLHQTFNDWECVCVNDGSTDESGAILDEYARKDKRFRVFHKPNGGVSSARNLALDHVRGEWIGFLDGDDVILSEWFTNALRAIERYQPDLVRQHFQLFFGDGRQRESFSIEQKVLHERSAILKWGADTFVKYGYLVLCFIRRELLQGCKCIDRLCVKEDMLFNFSVLMRTQRVVQTDYAGYLYRQREGSAVYTARTKEDYWLFISSMMAFWQEFKAVFTAYRVHKCVATALAYSIVLDILEMIDFYACRQKGESRKAIYRQVCEIHQQLKRCELLSLKGFHFHWAIAYWIYVTTSLRWPIQILKTITRWRQR